MLIRFFHYLGPMLWLGGAVASMVIASTTHQESREAKAALFRALARVHAIVIAPGALITAVSGIMLTMQMYAAGAGAALGQPGIALMQGAGIVAAVLVVAVSLPAANKRAAILKLPEDPVQDVMLAKLRTRQAWSSSLAGLMVVASLLGAVVIR